MLRGRNSYATTTHTPTLHYLCRIGSPLLLKFPVIGIGQSIVHIVCQFPLVGFVKRVFAGGMKLTHHDGLGRLLWDLLKYSLKT